MSRKGGNFGAVEAGTSGGAALLRALLLAAYALLSLSPIVWMVITSVKHPADTAALPPRFLPGASAPENLVQELIESLHGFGYGDLEEVEIKEEDVRFNLPSELSRTVQLHTIARV